MYHRPVPLAGEEGSLDVLFLDTEVRGLRGQASSGEVVGVACGMLCAGTRQMGIVNA